MRHARTHLGAVLAVTATLVVLLATLSTGVAAARHGTHHHDKTADPPLTLLVDGGTVNLTLAPGNLTLEVVNATPLSFGEWFQQVVGVGTFSSSTFQFDSNGTWSGAWPFYSYGPQTDVWWAEDVVSNTTSNTVTVTVT